MPGLLLGKSIAMVIAFRNFRDSEYFIPRDILEEENAEIKVASNNKGLAIGADGGDVNVDSLIYEINPADFDAIVLIGGPGCIPNIDNDNTYKLIREAVSLNKVLAAICISPVILAKAGVLKGKKATVWSSPMDKSAIKKLEEAGVDYQSSNVVVDGNIITAKGPAAALEFAQKIIEVLTKV